MSLVLACCSVLGIILFTSLLGSSCSPCGVWEPREGRDLAAHALTLCPWTWCRAGAR